MPGSKKILWRYPIIAAILFPIIYVPFYYLFLTGTDIGWFLDRFFIVLGGMKDIGSWGFASIDALFVIAPVYFAILGFAIALFNYNHKISIWLLAILIIVSIYPAFTVIREFDERKQMHKKYNIKLGTENLSAVLKVDIQTIEKLIEKSEIYRSNNNQYLISQIEQLLKRNNISYDKNYWKNL